MVRLYLDEDVHKKIATALRLKGYDVLSAHETGKGGLSDVEQFEFAVSEQRAIFTFNIGDFSKLHNEFINMGKSHYGVILSKQIPIGENIKRLTKFLFEHKDMKISNRIFWI